MRGYVVLVTIIILSGLVSAAPPSFITGDAPSGFAIKFPLKEVYKVNQGYNFEIHLFNSSNGVPIISGVACVMHLYNQTGNHIYTGFQNKTSQTYDYDFTVNGNNFSQVGQYYYYAQCNSSVAGGFAGEYIYVTAQGVPYSTTHGLVYVGLFILLMGIFIALLFFIFSLEVDNVMANDGKVLAINHKKYLRIFLVCINYVTFIAITYFAWNISYGILEFTEMASFFKFLFRTSYVIMYPLFVVIVIWSIAQYIKDRKLEEFIKRNLSFK